MWKKAFSQAPGYQRKGRKTRIRLKTLEALKEFIDYEHIKHCLMRPYFEVQDYPLVEARELLPSFEVDLYEHKNLPGFSMVAFERQLNSFQEIFQFDALHSPSDWEEMLIQDSCSVAENVRSTNLRTFLSRLPKRYHQDFLGKFESKDICALGNYDRMLPFLLELERAHVLAQDSSGEFTLQGMYASLPSNLDSELKQFGLKIGKFKPGNNLLYECNRLFVYQFMMELHGFPIVSERRTSSAMFAIRLLRQHERFIVRVLGQSDRTITTLMPPPKGTPRRSVKYPRVEKIALTQVNENQKELVEVLKDQGFFIDPKKRVVILRVTYQQHDYNARNVREDRALSVLKQEIIHPITGRIIEGLNIIQNVRNMILRLNDIVRGEYRIPVNYKRQELIESTETHEHRLKVLYVWLSKHMHRIVDYSDDYYSQLVRVLDAYLLSPEHYDVFNEYHDLHQEVWSRYSQIQQARKIRVLEELRSRKYKGETISYKRSLELTAEILNDLKFEIVNYFDKLVVKILIIGNDVVSDAYLLRTYVRNEDKDLSPYGREVKKLYQQLVMLLDEFRAIRKSRISSQSGSGQ
ncbi:MAG: hypothetical protein AB7E51_08605 [Pseudodesulfovibrio sp.]|jgi:hypothetical protein|uniref:Uncharacterized protein n=1 Tax=Pseudodesulfovibrio indicus TaxID=1716143 RepID=A0A126QQ10_9BACT|nr:hypothetical protein [Pseudodesulfovibrio indicus]AMK11808.1 hypothetical protein AWY79_12130 [Pseudodesulfovibrio indicus]TDT88350.1 hypothetical protein EDC59_106164 [Pseudodesulfovibrio indicus]